MANIKRQEIEIGNNLKNLRGTKWKKKKKGIIENNS